jgi:hypothetical protein
MSSQVLVIDYLIAESVVSPNLHATNETLNAIQPHEVSSLAFPLLRPPEMTRYFATPAVQIWRLTRRVSEVSIDTDPDELIGKDLDDMRNEYPQLVQHLDDVQHWWPIIYEPGDGQILTRIESYRDNTEQVVDWNFLLIRRASETQILEILKVAAYMVARYTGLSEALRQSQALMRSLPPVGDFTELRRSSDQLEATRRDLLTDLVVSDVRPNLYGSYMYDVFSSIREVWNLAELERSSQVSLSACEAVLSQIRSATQAKRDRLRDDTLLLLTVVSSVSAVFSFIGYLDSPGDKFEALRLFVSSGIAVGSCAIFVALRRINTR